MPNLFKVWKSKTPIRKTKLWFKDRAWVCVWVVLVAYTIIIWDLILKCCVNGFTHFIRMKRLFPKHEERIPLEKKNRRASLCIVYTWKIRIFFLLQIHYIYLLELELIDVYSSFWFQVCFNWHSRCLFLNWWG